MRSYVLLLAVVSMAAGCTPSVRVDVTGYRAANRAFPSPEEAQTVAIVTATDLGETLLMDEVAEKVDWLLRERGYKVTTKDSAVYLLECWFSMDPGQMVEEYERPIRHEVGYHYHSGGYSGYHWATEIRSGRTYAIHCKHLNLTLYDKASYDAIEAEEAAEADDKQIKQMVEGSAIWQCTAGTCNSGSDLRWIMNHLLLAAFEVLGEDTGKQRSITIKEDNERFVQLSEIKP